MIQAKYETREVFLKFVTWMLEVDMIREVLEDRAMDGNFKTARYGLEMSVHPVLKTFAPRHAVKQFLDQIVFGTQNLLEYLMIKHEADNTPYQTIETLITNKMKELVLEIAEKEVNEAKQELAERTSPSNLQAQMESFKATMEKDDRQMLRSMPKLYMTPLKTKVFIASEVGQLTCLLGNPAHLRRVDYVALLCEAVSWYYARVALPDVEVGTNLYANRTVQAYMQDKESGDPVPPIELYIPARALPYVRLRALMNGKRLLAQTIMAKEHFVGETLREDADALETELDAWIEAEQHNCRQELQISPK